MYYYQGFGLHISSEIEFPELMPGTPGTTDLRIITGKAPDKLEGPEVVHKVKVSMSPSEYLLNMGDTARYYAANGNKIIIEPKPGADIESVRLFMLTNVMAAILHQQNRIPLHASGLMLDEGLVLFTGPSGIGKSTTAYGMMQQGFQLFCDDVCVLNYNNEGSTVEAVASYPMLKLWENTIEHFSLQENKNTLALRPLLPKKGFLLHDRFSDKHYPVWRIYILKTDSRIENITCRKLNSIDAFNEIQKNTYRRKQVDMMQLRQPHFEMITRLITQAQVFEIKRPDGEADISKFIDFIKSHMTSYAET